jgi:hypothetical protein
VEISAGLGAALDSIDDLNVHDTLGGPYNLPCVIVDVPTIETYEVTFGRTGETTVPFDVTVFVSRADDQIAIAELLSYVDAVGDKSVRAALMADPDLGGQVEHTYLRSYNRIVTDLDGSPAFGGSFTVDVTFKRERI